MKALILAAGYAVRLYPLTKKYPKPLLPIRNKPIIDYIIEKLDTIEELDEIIVITNSKFVSKFKEWTKKVKRKKPISLSDELTKNNLDRKGAIGDLHFAITRGKLKDDLLVIGGDNLFDGSLLDFVRFAKAKKTSPVIGVYDIKDRRKTSKYGVVRLNKNNRITGFKEKPKASKSTLVAMCLYFFPKDKLGLVGRYQVAAKNKYDAAGLYIDWLRKVTSVYGFIFDCRWFDIGDHTFYREAQKSFSS